MNAIKKLLRLKEITQALAQPVSVCAGVDRLALEIERNNIMESVGVPPANLQGSKDADRWATEFTKVFPSVDPQLASIWFDEAMTAATEDGPHFSGICRNINKPTEFYEWDQLDPMWHAEYPRLTPQELVAVIRDLQEELERAKNVASNVRSDPRAVAVLKEIDAYLRAGWQLGAHTIMPFPANSQDYRTVLDWIATATRPASNTSLML